MTLDEAIKHCEEVAEANDLAVGMYEILAENNHNAYEKLTAETNSSRCAECAADHRQLADWLTELKERRAADVQPVNRWISIDEALPKVGQRVLVYYPDWIEDEELQVAHLAETYGAGIQFVTYDDVRLPTVTHWQPLPEPPKEG